MFYLNIVFYLNIKLILYCFVFSRTTWSQQCIRPTSNEWRFQQDSASREVMKIQLSFTGCQTLKNCSVLFFLTQPGGLWRGQFKTKSKTRVFKGHSTMIGGVAIGNHVQLFQMFSQHSTRYSTISKYSFFAIWHFFGSFVPFGRYLKIFFRNLNWSLQFFDDDQNFFG